MVLFVNACVRPESRTRRLAEAVLEKLGGTVTELRLWELPLPKIDEEFLHLRDSILARGEWDAPLLGYARQFARAEEIVIAAPYWDLSFPSLLKAYLEQLCVVGVTFRYTPEGVPQGLCRAKKLWYVTTAGGGFVPEEFGYGYVKALAQGFFGIPETELVKAVGLDLVGADPEEILGKAIEEFRTSPDSCQ